VFVFANESHISRMIQNGDRVTRDDERRRLKAYSKFANTPAGSIRVNWTEPNQVTHELSKAETCKNYVRTWHKQLKEACSDCTAEKMTADDDDDVMAVIELIDRLMSNTDNPIYKRITAGTTKRWSLSKFQMFDDDKRNTTDGELKQPTTRADRKLSNGNKLTFKDEWIDLVHLKSTREFCLYLKNNPHLMRPDYLVQIGFFDDNREYARTMGTRRKINSKSSAKHVLQ